MTSKGITTALKVTMEMVKDLVLSIDGGDWFTYIGIEGGRVYRGDFFVNIGGDTNLTPFLDEEETALLTSLLGSAPQSTIELSYSGSPQADAIAAEVAQRMVTAWQGVIEEDVL